MNTSSHNEALQTAVVVVIMALLIVRRMRGRRVYGGRAPIVIAIMVVYGAVLIGTAVGVSYPSHLTEGDVVLLGVGTVVSLALGAIRGTTVRMFLREGELYARYTPLTVVLWLVTFAVRLGIGTGASHVNASHTVAQASLVMMVALSLAGETVVVRARGKQAVNGVRPIGAA
ncbi:hypothetical protein POF50_031670 [Streptomyces sp. SL13]|uniref:DUF1453 domain-containing protein n=1 Tax=Streptantibioticus silvisoli TaxID=2705255 RepID=A0AA90H4A1_9ACTN|nr:hypothetical protein [Streptantibioticus silvisoli]MDI5973848.1 hypothetical protein [Streptantibioticus silvisoli]